MKQIATLIAVLGAAVAAHAQSRTNSLGSAEFLISASANTNWNAHIIRVTPSNFNFNRRLLLNVEIRRPGGGIIDRKIIVMPPAAIRQWTASTNDKPKRWLSNWIMSHQDMDGIAADPTAVEAVAADE